MATTLYFVRHAEPNYNNYDDLTRELTDKGLQDSQKLVNFFNNKPIDNILSSPYKRAIETIKPLSEQRQLDIEIIDAFKERKIDNVWIDDFNAFAKQQWLDKSYKLANGESLQEVQERQVKAVNHLLAHHTNKTLLIGAHGTALSCLINYYQPSFDYNHFESIKHLFPFVATFTFDDSHHCSSITINNIFTGETHDIYSI